nr:hypothetical protein [Tanacetum cinerariifolium]
MSSLFAYTHNVVANLEKSNAAEGFEQIIDFLSGSYIHYALTVNPHIYISCIKQFWNTASVKRSGDITSLQALVDKKKIVISEAIIREILQLDDAEGVNQVGDLSTHSTRYISPALTQKVFANMRRVGKGFSGVETLFLRENVTEEVVEVANEAIPSPPSHHIPPPSQEQTPPPQQPHISHPAPPQGKDFPVHFQQVLDTCSALTRRVEHLEHDNVGHNLEIVKLKARAEIYNLDLDHPSNVLSMQEDDSEVQEVVEVVTTAKLITDVVTTASQVSAASITISAANPSIPAAALTVVAAYTKRRKGVIIRDPEEELSLKTPTGTPELKDKDKGILVESLKPMKKKDQIELDAEYARKLHKEINKDDAEINKDIDWDAVMDYSREEMKEEDQEIIKSINKTPAHKAAKKRKLNEEAEELKKQLEIVNDEDDDVFTEATPLRRKTMFEKTDGQDAIWRNQNSVYGQALLLELMLSKRSKKNTKCVNAADEELTTAKHKLMLLVYCCLRVNAAK